MILPVIFIIKSIIIVIIMTMTMTMVMIRLMVDLVPFFVDSAT